MKNLSNRTINVTLGTAAAILALLCILSIASPMQFEREKTQREAVVKQHLLLIRSAENRYMRRHGQYTGSLDSLVANGLLADSLRYIPYSNGKQFEIETSSSISASGKAQPLMVCSARYEDYLDGLDEADIANATEEANQQGLFPGLKFGDVTTPNGNAANWE